jgi:threonine/homoserine/homoserine lactone efflux protein
MITEQAIAFALFAIVAAVTPGPSNVVLTSTGATVGVLRGLPCLLGVAVGMGLMMFVVGFGLGSVVLASPLVLQGIKWCGSIVLLWLAWKIATASRSKSTGAAPFLGFWPAVVFQWVNPKSWLVTAGAVGTFLHAGAGSALAQSLFFGLVFAVVTIPCCFVWLAFGAGLQRVLQGDRAARFFNVAMGAMLAGSVVLFIV